MPLMLGFCDKHWVLQCVAVGQRGPHPVWSGQARVIFKDELAWVWIRHLMIWCAMAGYLLTLKRLAALRAVGWLSAVRHRNSTRICLGRWLNKEPTWYPTLGVCRLRSRYTAYVSFHRPGGSHHPRAYHITTFILITESPEVISSISL